MEEVAGDLQFPEGPISLADGSVLVVEIQSGNLSRITPSGSKSVLAHCGGGPNGAAIGPDDHVYVCNNGGFGWADVDNSLPQPAGQRTTSAVKSSELTLEPARWKLFIHRVPRSRSTLRTT